MPGKKDGIWEVNFYVTSKSEMAGPFNRGDTLVNKHFTKEKKTLFNIAYFETYNICSVELLMYIAT